MDYLKIVKKNCPKENVFYNALTAFLVGGLLGIIGQGLIDLYQIIFDISLNEASTLMIISLIFISCLLTSLGFFDKLVTKAKCGLIIPITVFAHAMQSCALEYRREGLITGIGSNIFKLTGSVIAFGIFSAYLFGFMRVILGC